MAKENTSLHFEGERCRREAEIDAAQLGSEFVWLCEGGCWLVDAKDHDDALKQVIEARKRFGFKRDDQLVKVDGKLKGETT